MLKEGVADSSLAIPRCLVEALLLGETEQGTKSIRDLLETRGEDLPLWGRKPAHVQLTEKLFEMKKLGKPPERNGETFLVPGVKEILPDFNNGSPWCKDVLQELESILSLRNEKEKKQLKESFDQFLSCLGKPGILFLLDHRSTIGTIDSLCPPISRLLEAFNKLHTKPPPDENTKNKKGARVSQLTVGGRAFTKHCHRSEFWPNPNGSEAVKNSKALSLFKEFIQDACWINVHVVPSGKKTQLPIVEIRGSKGYGMRFSADGYTFRGFLEPVSPYFEGNKTN